MVLDKTSHEYNMKNGYYLSTYCSINSLGYLKNIESRHDANLSLWKKDNDSVELVHYWELERVTGLKQHNMSFYNKEHAESVINQLLCEYDLCLDDMVEVWGTPGIGKANDYFSDDANSEYAYHTILHAYSALALNTDKFYNRKILCLSVDSSPDKLIDKNAFKKKFYMGVYSDKGNICEFDISSPADLWECAKTHYGLREGSLMALASACTCEIVNEVEIDYCSYDFHSRAKSIANVNQLLNQLDDFDVLNVNVAKNYDNRFSERENRISMVMKMIQKKSLEIMSENIDVAIKKYNLEPSEMILSIAGGFGLNCPCNSYMMKKYHFKEFIAPPSINDAGISLGLALHQFIKREKRINFHLKNSFYGDESVCISEVLKKYSQYVETVEDMSYDKVCEDIVDSPIVWFDGRAEMGPRALGHRSILANAMSESAKTRLNEIKKREWWRPVAPMIIENKIDEWFDETYISPYMLNNFNVKQEKKTLIPAVIHLDGSARVQTVNQEDNKVIYKVLQKFEHKYGVPIICNTSLNDKGEPIINTEEEAINFALRKNIKVMYINRIRITLKNHNLFEERACAKRKIDFKNYISSENEKKSNLEQLNPFKCSDELIDFYVRYNEDIDITNEKGVKELKISYKVNKKLYEL